MGGLLLLVLRQLLALAALTVLSWLWGRRAMARLLDPLPPLEAGAFSVGIGLGAIGAALFLLGLVGGLAPLPVGALAALSALLLWRWRRPRRAGAALAGAVPSGAPVAGALPPGALVGATPSDARLAGAIPSGALLTGAIPSGTLLAGALPSGALLAGALLVLPAFVLSLYPPAAFDETTYHLPLAAAFAHSHHLAVVPEALFPVSPQLLELLFAALLTTAGDIATHSVQFLCMVATTAALFAAGERYAGRRAGAVAAALWLANPLVQYEAASSYVDLGLTLFCLLAVLAWEHWQQEGSRWWLVAAGALVGFAAATKHLGLVWLGLLALATWCAAPRGRRAAASGLFLAGAGAVLLPWVVRSVVETANPIFPLLTDWFPSAGSRLERAAGAPLAQGWLGTSHYVAHLVTARRQAWALVSLPWRVAFDRQGFHHQAPLSPYSLLLLPLVAWYAWRERRLRRWLLLIAAYAALGTTTDPRFQLPSVALLALAGGIAVARALARLETTRWARWNRPASVAALALAVAALGPLYAGYKIWRHGPLPATAAAREAFLVRELPGYRAIQSLNAHCGAGYTLFAFDGENLTYYTRGRFLGQRSGPFAQRPLVPLLRDPERLHAALLAWGVDDLLVNHPFQPYQRLAPVTGIPAPPAAPGAGLRGQRTRKGFAPPWFQPLPGAPPAELFALLDAAGEPRGPCAAALPLPGGEGRGGGESER